MVCAPVATTLTLQLNLLSGLRIAEAGVVGVLQVSGGQNRQRLANNRSSNNAQETSGDHKVHF